MESVVTRKDVSAAMTIMLAVANGVKALGRVPSGHLYATLMNAGMNLQQYDIVLAKLKSAELISEDAQHVLHWVGDI